MLRRETITKESEILDENTREKIEEYVTKNYKKLLLFSKNDGDGVNFTKEVYDIIKFILPKEKDQEECFYYFTDYFQELTSKNCEKLNIPGSVTTSSIKEIKAEKDKPLCADFDTRDLKFTWIPFYDKWQGKTISEDGKEMLYDLSLVFRFSNAGKCLYIIKLDSPLTPMKISTIEPEFDCYVKQGEKAAKKMTLKSLCKTIYARTPIVVGQLEFNPDAPINSKNMFNLWRGFKAKRLPKYDMEKIRFPLDHLRELVQTDEWYHWCLSFFAAPLKKPYEKTEKCLIFAGPQGIGKDFLGELFINHIYGHEHAVSLGGLDKGLQKFNSNMEKRLFTNIQELFMDKKTSRAIFEILKFLITGKFQTIERKGIDPVTMMDCNNFFCTSNHRYECIHLEEDDRRFAIPELSDKVHDKKYFDKLFSYCNQETADHLFTYLLEYNNLDVRDRNNIPYSNVKEINKLCSEQSSVAFIYFLEHNNVEWETYEFVPSEIKEEDGYYYVSKDHIYQFYVAWCKKHGYDIIKVSWFWRSIMGKISSWKRKPDNDRNRFNRLSFPDHIDLPTSRIIDI